MKKDSCPNNCGNLKQKRSKLCNPCSGVNRRGKKNHNYGTGRTVNGSGYVLLGNKRDHPNAQATGYILEHVWVMSEYLERPLVKGETVHHINGNRQDNRLENLQLRVGQHGAGSSYACMDCGSDRIEPIPLAVTEIYP